MNVPGPATDITGPPHCAPATSGPGQAHTPAATPSAGRPTAATGGGRRPGRLIRAVLLPLRFYQRVISPALPRRCKYHPTCSDYAVQAISSYGILRGGTLAGWRLLRCNPWSHGGYDPVSAQNLFHRPPRSPQPPPSDS